MSQIYTEGQGGGRFLQMESSAFKGRHGAMLVQGLVLLGSEVPGPHVRSAQTAGWMNVGGALRSTSGRRGLGTSLVMGPVWVTEGAGTEKMGPLLHGGGPPAPHCWSSTVSCLGSEGLSLSLSLTISISFCSSLSPPFFSVSVAFFFLSSFCLSGTGSSVSFSCLSMSGVSFQPPYLGRFVLSGPR